MAGRLTWCSLIRPMRCPARTSPGCSPRWPQRAGWCQVPWSPSSEAPGQGPCSGRRATPVTGRGDTAKRPSGTVSPRVSNRHDRWPERWSCVSRVVCPGSFDPVTNGHLDIIARAARLYDEVVVAVLINIHKKTLFTTDERVEMLEHVTASYPNVRVTRFHGLIVDFCKEHDIPAIVR